ncbi:MAG TPA: hypothetical protein VN643_07080 [Pyrinomonadaceae bacterium]|nr:hypothetical protein [Pyrinomonadaceae bacterium]
MRLRQREEIRHRERLKALETVLAMLREERDSLSSDLTAVDLRGREPRVRGVRKAVEEILPDLPEVFDRVDVMRRLKETNPHFATKVTGESLRDTLRLLSKNKTLTLREEATNSRPARYAIRKIA